MSGQLVQPTPYQDVNVFLNLLLPDMQVILKDQFVGLYLGGSLALGDFDPQRSDIDFVAVTSDTLPPETVGALQEMHARLWATGEKWAMKLDGSYVPKQVVRRWSADDPACPFVEADGFYITRQGSAAIQRHIIHQSGVVVAGPSPQTLIDPLGPEDLRSVLWDMLEKWWLPLLDDPDWVQQRQNQPFAILTMCRALYALERGAVGSKPVTARWAQQATGEPWTALIEWALGRPHDTNESHLAPTLGFIQYTLDRYHRYQHDHKRR